jgi:hypothetical protein
MNMRPTPALGAPRANDTGKGPFRNRIVTVVG